MWSVAGVTPALCCMLFNQLTLQTPTAACLTRLGRNYRLLRGARVCFVVTNGHWTGVWFSHRFRFTQTGWSKAEKYKNAQLSLTNPRDVKPCKKFR